MNEIKHSGALIDGYIEIRRQQGKKKPILNIHHNTMNEHAQNVLLALSASLMLNGASPTPFNRLCTTTPGMVLPQSPGYGYTGAIRFFDSNATDGPAYGLTVFFLKLDQEELDALKSSSKYLPIKDTNGEISEKVVAYGVYKLKDSGKKTGTLTFSDPSKLVENFSSANAWYFEADKAFFDYNVIAISSISPINIFAAYKCISRVNIHETGAKLTSSFVIPGFGGITGANEIMLNYESNGVTKWKYNLKTGETTALEENEKGINMEMNYMHGQQVVMGDTLFSQYRQDNGAIMNIVQAFGSNGEKLQDISVETYGQYCKLRGLFTDGEKLYASVPGYTDDYGSFFEINPSTYAVQNIKNSEFKLWGNLPSEWNPWETYIKASYVVQDHRYYVVGNIEKNVQFIVSDLTDIEGSIVAEAPVFDCVVSIDNTEDGVFFICSGTKKNEQNPSYSSNADRSYTAMLPASYIKNEDGSSIVENDLSETGVWINNNSFANFLSFEKYTEMQHKTIAQNLTITYGYEIGIR